MELPLIVLLQGTPHVPHCLPQGYRSRSSKHRAAACTRLVPVEVLRLCGFYGCRAAEAVAFDDEMALFAHRLASLQSVFDGLVFTEEFSILIFLITRLIANRYWYCNRNLGHVVYQMS